LSLKDRQRATLLSLLSQMELLLKRESLLATIPANATPEKAHELAVLIDGVLEAAEMELERQLPGGNLTEYIDTHGLSSLFPRTAERLGCTSLPPPNQPDFLSHLAKMNLLNQATSMSVQLFKDVNGLRNHKYLAHQVALLYVGLLRPSSLPRLTNAPDFAFAVSLRFGNSNHCHSLPVNRRTRCLPPCREG
jgi:hypothetical protein